MSTPPEAAGRERTVAPCIPIKPGQHKFNTEEHPIKQRITAALFMIGVIGAAVVVHIYFAP